MVTYSSISRYYDLWSSGDKYWNITRDFYVGESRKHKGPIVELGIGTARIAAEILKDHHTQIIGVDICEEMLEEGEKRLAELGLLQNVLLLRQDFTRLKLPQKSNYIFMPFRTFGHLPDDESRRAALQAIYNNLNEKGSFVFDHYILDQQWAEKVAGKKITMYEGEGVVITDTYDFDLENQKMHCQVCCNDEVMESFDFYWFEPEHIKKLIEEVGFHIKAVYGNFDKTQLRIDSPNQIWILEK
ncbi:methyltransferase domain-containing protein [Anaerocolumna sp. AGMB13020]|uniref:class I SAM-dependent methyltransferase n=1 Tax=Anaerocolumna sp. AGMB13020 TaxID=3081750 RepID=UPI002952C0BB|nr:methyltransferase domain-containing protein [Anaerocolumna sp. AGMB13020]WOO36839.1 methyltransferase domain-containing protein [Anaerocolumna sp. AGMB13020]